jgi:hypothetical protein
VTDRAARRLVGAFFAINLIALTFPGVMPFNRLRPFVLGLPFNFFWVVLWVVLGGAALWWLDARTHGESSRTRGGGGR